MFMIEDYPTGHNLSKSVLRNRRLDQPARQIPCAVHQAPGFQRVIGYSIEDQKLEKRRFDRERPKPLKYRLPKTAASPEIGLASKFEQCVVNRLKETPRQIFARLIEIPAKLLCDIRVE